jgi:hypothetical protein
MLNTWMRKTGPIWRKLIGGLLMAANFAAV